MFDDLNHIASTKNEETQTTWKAMQYFLNYAASNPDTKIVFHVSNMWYKIDLDVAY